MAELQARVDKMLGGKDVETQENIVRNAYKSAGIDIDQAIKQLQQQKQIPHK